MRKYRFYKNELGWFIDLKYFPFDKAWLAMVQGADELLDKISGNKDEITLEISTYPIPFDDGYLELDKNLGIVWGAIYNAKETTIEHSFDIEGKKKSQLWLCPATLWVFLKYPKKIYYKIVKKRIGLDIDGVLADFSTHFLNYLDFEDKSPATSWDDSRFRDNFHRIENDDQFWLTIPTLIKAEELSFTPSIYVTARPCPTEITKRWLAINRFPPAPIKTVGMGGSKVDALLGKVDMFIDDALHNYKELNKHGVNCVLMTRSHNYSTYVNKRINSLTDI